MFFVLDKTTRILLSRLISPRSAHPCGSRTGTRERRTPGRGRGDFGPGMLVLGAACSCSRSMAAFTCSQVPCSILVCRWPLRRTSGVEPSPCRERRLGQIFFDQGEGLSLQPLQPSTRACCCWSHTHVSAKVFSLRFRPQASKYLRVLSSHFKYVEDLDETAPFFIENAGIAMLAWEKFALVKAIREFRARQF